MGNGNTRLSMHNMLKKLFDKEKGKNPFSIKSAIETKRKHKKDLDISKYTK